MDHKVYKYQTSCIQEMNKIANVVFLKDIPPTQPIFFPAYLYAISWGGPWKEHGEWAVTAALAADEVRGGHFWNGDTQAKSRQEWEAAGSALRPPGG